MNIKVGDWVEYHTTQWQQQEAGLAPVEIVEIIGIDNDGGLSYNNSRAKGHIGSFRMEESVKPLAPDSVITYWEWDKKNYGNEFSVTLKKRQSTIIDIRGSIAMIELFNGVKRQVDLREILFDSKTIDYEYFKENIANQFNKSNPSD